MGFRKAWHKYLGFLKLVRSDHPNIVWVIGIGSLAGAAQPFVHLFFYARLLNQVLAGRYEDCIRVVAILLISTLVLNLIAKACSQSILALKEAGADTIFFQTADKSFRMEYEEFEKTETMDAIRRVRSGEQSTGGIEAQIQSIYTLTEKIISTLIAFGFVVILFSQTKVVTGSFFTSIWSNLLMLLMYILLLVLGVMLLKRSYQKFYEYSKKNEHLNALGQYMISLMNNYQYGKEIRIFALQKLIEGYYDDMVKRMKGFYLNWGIKEGTLSAIILFLTQLASGILYIIIGARAIYGAIPVGDVLMYAGAVLLFTNSMQEALIDYNSFHYRSEYLSTYEEFIKKPNIHYTGTLPVEKRTDGMYEFTFEHVSFQYPGTQDIILKDVSLNFKIGSKCAIVGRNGAGKTTLIKLLCRLYDPTEGRILLNGIDIRYYDYSEYSSLFSVVFQDFKLLALPLAYNVSCAEEVEEERMWKILEQTGMKERVERMPNKLYTLLYKNNGDGVELSGGEAQKLAIARALYKDAPFVILDEPTAALDPIAEAEVYQNFNDMIQGKTAVYISHRMSSCKFCDDIIVLDSGRIAEQGNHNKLLKKEGIYASLYNAQAQYYT